MNQLYSKSWHRKALQLKLQGVSNRQIARELWGASDGESKLRRFFKREDIQAILGEVAVAPKRAKILFWDIETTPHHSRHFDWWGTNINPMIHNIGLGFMLSHAWCWGIDGEVHSSILTPEEVLKGDDSRIVLEMHSLFEHADVIIAHNGKRFDIKKANASFAHLGLLPPSPYKVIDTLRISKKFFSLPSHSLSFLCHYFNLGVEKVKTDGFELWARCCVGDPEALELMRKYNIGDIPTLVKLYTFLRPWGNDGVDISMLSTGGGLICPTCGGDHTEPTGSTCITSRKIYQVHKCTECGAQSKLIENTKTSYLTKI